MKKQKGMGHITLVICIVVIIAILSIAVNVIQTEANDRVIENLITDMLLVQGKVKVIAQENEMNEENPLIGKKVQENLEDEKVKKMIENNVISEEEDNFDKYYIIDSEILSQMNLEDTLQEEYYIVNYSNYKIIYSKGISIEDQMHYTLEQLLEHRNKNIDMDENEGQINEEQINQEETQELNEEG